MRLPYLWFTKNKDPNKRFEFFHYVMAKHALTKAVHDGDKKVVADCPPDAPKGNEALEWIYQLLNILDTKASALMRLNGVMLAAAAFLLNPQFNAWPTVKYAVAFSGIGSTLSIAVCLLVVSVDWRFLGFVTKNSANGKVVFDFSNELFRLQNVADFRQGSFRLAWAISFVTALAFLFASVGFFVKLISCG